MRVKNQVMGTAIININSKIGAYSIKGNAIPVSTLLSKPTVRRVARDLRNELLQKIQILQSDMPKNTPEDQ